MNCPGLFNNVPAKWGGKYWSAIETSRVFSSWKSNLHVRCVKGDYICTKLWL